MPGMHDDELCQVIVREARRIQELGGSHDLSTGTIGLGRWKLRDVIAHLGGVHRWATRTVSDRSMDGPSFRKSKLDGVDLLEWFEEGAAALIDALHASDPSEPCPNFSPGSNATVGWWIRRQAHETTVHRWDVERPIGEATPIADALGADGIDEFLDTFVRPRGKHSLRGALSISVPHPARSWTLRPTDRPGRLAVDVDTRFSDDVVAGIEGPAGAALLVLWRRLNVADAGLTVTGDRDVASSFRPLGD